MTGYYGEMLSLGRRIMALLALSLEFEEQYFEEAFNMPPATLRLIKYPPHRATPISIRSALERIRIGGHHNPCAGRYGWA